MDLTPPTAAATNTTAAQPKSAEPSAASALSSDFETFLTMFTTQMENQDPMNPVESADFAVQLATFSGVEQQVRTNDLLEELGKSMGGSGVAQLAGWVGMEARSVGPARFDGSPLTLTVSPEADAGSADLIVRDADGRVVSREAVSPSGGTMDWAGLGADGAPLPPGTYEFFVESRAGGDTLSTKPVEVYAEVTEAKIENGTTVVGFADGRTAPAEAVTGLRRPPEA